MANFRGNLRTEPIFLKALRAKKYQTDGFVLKTRGGEAPEAQPFGCTPAGLFNALRQRVSS
jgi:hypothetical protein